MHPHWWSRRLHYLRELRGQSQICWEHWGPIAAGYLFMFLIMKKWQPIIKWQPWKNDNPSFMFLIMKNKKWEQFLKQWAPPFHTDSHPCIRIGDPFVKFGAPVLSWGRGTGIRPVPNVMFIPFQIWFPSISGTSTMTSCTIVWGTSTSLSMHSTTGFSTIFSTICLSTCYWTWGKSDLWSKGV